MKLITMMFALCLAATGYAGTAYQNTTFGYRLACPDGWQTSADAAAAAVVLGLPQGPMKAKLSAAERPAAVTPEICEKLRLKDEAALAAKGTAFKRIPFGQDGSRWATAYRAASGTAQIAVTSLFSYPRGDKHVWIRLHLVAPFTAAKEAGKQMRALVAGFAAEPPVAAPVNVVGTSGAAESILLDETGALAKVSFEPAPLEVELPKYQNEVFQPVVAMEARLAKLFDDVQVRAERGDLTGTGKIAMFREIVQRYKRMIEPLEASVPTQQDLAAAHAGVVGFYRERANIYDRIVESTAANDSNGTVKAAQELAHHDFQNTQAYQQLTQLAQKAAAAPQGEQVAANDGPPPVAPQN